MSTDPDIGRHFARVVTERNAAYRAAREAAMLIADAIMTNGGQLNGDLRERTLVVYRQLYEVAQNGQLATVHEVEAGSYCECDLCSALGDRP